MIEAIIDPFEATAPVGVMLKDADGNAGVEAATSSMSHAETLKIGARRIDFSVAALLVLEVLVCTPVLAG